MGNTILITSTVMVKDKSFDPLVLVEDKGVQNLLSPKQAIKLAIGIINAAAYAESETGIFMALTSQEPRIRSLDAPSLINNETLKVTMAAIQIVRDYRKPLPPGVDVIFGKETQKGLVTVQYPKTGKTFLSPEEAREHARVMLVAAESALSDSFWYKQGRDRLKLSPAEVERILKEYATYKELLIEE